MLTFWALALVALRPWYRLEISRHIEQATRGALTLSVSMIYPLLKRLEVRALVVRRWERTSGGPLRADYTATAAGRKVLRDYVRSVLAPQSPIYRALSELLGQMPSMLKDRR